MGSLHSALLAEKKKRRPLCHFTAHGLMLRQPRGASRNMKGGGTPLRPTMRSRVRRVTQDPEVPTRRSASDSRASSAASEPITSSGSRDASRALRRSSMYTVPRSTCKGGRRRGRGAVSDGAADSRCCAPEEEEEEEEEGEDEEDEEKRRLPRHAPRPPARFLPFARKPTTGRSPHCRPPPHLLALVRGV